MPATQKLIPLSARTDWEAALDGIPHAFAHTWQSCQAMSLTTSAPTYLYVWRSGLGRAVCPLAERTHLGHSDVFTPYGFSGFVGVGDWTGMLDDWREFAERRDYVCGFFAINPLLTDPLVFDREEVHEYNDLFILDLRKGSDELFASLSANRRRQIRAFSTGSSGLIIDRTRCGAFLLEHLPGFYSARGAGEAYRFSENTIQCLLDPSRSLLIGAAQGGEIEAVCLIVFTPYVADYFVGVSTPGGRAHSAALLWHGALELARMGIPFLNLGGGVARGDGIADFKARFGGTTIPLQSLKQVYRTDVYRDLCMTAGTDPVDRSGYFPPYRRTAPGVQSALRRGTTITGNPNDRTCS